MTTDNTQSKTVLHVGCGTKETGKLHQQFSDTIWKEIRLDINPDVRPDIVASITDMHMIEDNSMDAVYSSHNLEHLFAHEVRLCLKEFLRVLSPQGFALIAVPNLKAVAQFIAENKFDAPVYQSQAGPIYPLDIIYGHRPSIERGNIHMAHKTGFTPESLGNSVITAGFAWAKYAEDTVFGLWIKAYKQTPPQDVADQPL